MRPTYENIYISSFVFSLGYLFRKKSKGEASSVSIDLYQQVAAGERLVGDLLTSIGGKNIIVEFKRDSSGITNEFEKKSKEPLRRLMNSEEEMKLQEISKKCHFLSFASVYKNGGSTLAFASYIDLLKNSPDIVVYGNKDFSAKYISDQDFNIGVDDSDFKYYLSKLASSTGGTCGGMAMSIDDEGIRAMVIFDDIQELSQSLQLAEDRAEKLSQSKEPSYGPSPTFGPR